MMTKTILLIGRNPGVLANLASALVDEGFSVQATDQVEDAGKNVNALEFDLIAFGRGIDEQTNARLRAEFTSQNPAVLFVNGLAPVTSLLVRQIKQALLGSGVVEKLLLRFTCQQTEPLSIQVVVAAACQLTIDLYRLDAVHHTQQQTLVSAYVTAGNHTFVFTEQSSSPPTINFLVAEANSRDLLVLPLK